jgi:3',5'-cyclic AMP phosphodiesterase CpdA
MALPRRDFLKWGGAILAGVGSARRALFSSSDLSKCPSPPPSLAREHLLSDEFPFPFDEEYFACAERIYNLRAYAAGWRAGLSLVMKPGKKLDVKVLTAESPEGLAAAKDVITYYGVGDILETDLFAGDIPRLYYQVLYREGGAAWKALAPRSVKIPAGLDRGGELKVILLADDHTFDDGDYAVPDELKAAKLSGDYVNTLLRELRFNPLLKPQTPLRNLKNGLSLAHALRYIMANEDPDLIINLGDTTGIGAAYKWAGLGLPTVGLTDREYDDISHTLWLRMRKIYSGLTPYVPFVVAQGNHDGEEQWNPARFRAGEWRKRLFPMPDDRTFPEGGHPDGLYYALSLGTDISYRGGARFIILHTTAFAGDPNPRKPEDWTLGEGQLRWFENTLRAGERDWVFACLHHVLGGWPAGSSESEKSYSYGRGPLFTFEDYLGYADPSRVEQVRLTELGREHGLRAFLYGHDHIFHSRPIVQDLGGKDMIGVCCGSTKYMGEAGWWKGAYWHKHYGPSEPPASQFWGPPGLTRLTLRKNEAVIEYIVTGYSPYTNIPAGAGVGTVLTTRRLVNQPARLVVEQGELFFRAAEGRIGPPPHVLRIKNGGGGALRFSLKPDADWISASPASGQSWGEWDEIGVRVRTRRLAAGPYRGSIVIESDESGGTPHEVRVHLTVEPFFSYPPRNFRGWKTESGDSSPAELDISLAWSPHPLNRSVSMYRLYRLEDTGNHIVLGEVGAKIFTFTVKNMARAKAHRFALAAVDRKGREGQRAYTTVL